LRPGICRAFIPKVILTLKDLKSVRTYETLVISDNAERAKRALKTNHPKIFESGNPLAALENIEENEDAKQVVSLQMP